MSDRAPRLDDRAALRAADPHGAGDVIADFPAQCRAAVGIEPRWLPSTKRPRVVVIAGMGGSAAAGDLVAGCAAAHLEVPVVVHRGYGLPSVGLDDALVVALGHRPEIAPSYRVGVKSRWLLGDLDHLLTRLGTRDRDLQLPDLASSKLRTLIDFFKFAGPDLHYEVINREDLRPFFYECRQWVRALSRTPGS